MTTPISDEQLAEVEEIAFRDTATRVTVKASELRGLIARLRAAEADAKRYRWLRDKNSMPGVICTNGQAEKYFNEYMMCGEVMDKAIDAAMERTP
ncbi:TPA: hypothetical protein SHT49_002599 [Pseudomonas aeruginosa]|nr:hypothetical protein [Pseudomonas aeruginosa]HEH6389863.1 hypothetical protein [Pseudomonas aeruginosa]